MVRIHPSSPLLGGIPNDQIHKGKVSKVEEKKKPTQENKKISTRRGQESSRSIGKIQQSKAQKIASYVGLFIHNFILLYALYLVSQTITPWVWLMAPLIVLYPKKNNSLEKFNEKLNKIKSTQSEMEAQMNEITIRYLEAVSVIGYYSDTEDGEIAQDFLNKYDITKVDEGPLV